MTFCESRTLKGFFSGNFREDQKISNSSENIRAGIFQKVYVIFEKSRER